VTQEIADDREVADFDGDELGYLVGKVAKARRIE
jgi:hypothetical protein